jgi:hypothetical protein
VLRGTSRTRKQRANHLPPRRVTQVPPTVNDPKESPKMRPNISNLQRILNGLVAIMRRPDIMLIGSFEHCATGARTPTRRNMPRRSR